MRHFKKINFALVVFGVLFSASYAHATTMTLTPLGGTSHSPSAYTIDSDNRVGHFYLWFDGSGNGVASSCVDPASAFPASLATAFCTSASIPNDTYSIQSLNALIDASCWSGDISTQHYSDCHTSPGNDAELFFTINDSPPPPPPPSTTTEAVATSTPFFLLFTSVGLFLMELFTFLLILFIVFAVVGWPIRILIKNMRRIIKRA